MKQAPKKITIENILGLKLYMLNSDTAEICCGTFTTVIKYDDDERDSTFTVENGIKINFSIDRRLFINRIDLIFNKIERYKRKESFEGEVEQGVSGLNSNWYLMFTSLEKAKEVNKTIVIPKLVKDKIQATNEHLEGYMTATHELGLLEDRLKE